MAITQEQLEALRDAITKSTGGGGPDQPASNPTLPPKNPNNLNIVPPKPDPEAAANAQIMQAASTGARPMQGNGINPDTGMPYFSPQANAQSPEDAQRQQMQAFKMQYLKNKAQGQ